MPPDTRMTRQQRGRLRLMLQACDGRNRGASYRAMPRPSSARACRGRSLEDVSLRDRVIGLVEGGTGLIAGGYLRLFRHRRRRDGVGILAPQSSPSLPTFLLRHRGHRPPPHSGGSRHAHGGPLHATRSRHPPAALPAHQGSRRVSQPFGPHAGKAPHLWHRSRLSQARRAVVYSIDDLQAWTERGAVTSTSDPRGSVLPAKRHALAAGSFAGRAAR